MNKVGAEKIDPIVCDNCGKETPVWISIHYRVKDPEYPKMAGRFQLWCIKCVVLGGALEFGKDIKGAPNE